MSLSKDDLYEAARRERLNPTTPPRPATADSITRWTLHGYAPGDYHCHCFVCGQAFVGDKRATNCLTCAAKMAALSTPPAPVSPDLRGLVEQWREKASACRVQFDDDKTSVHRRYRLRGQHDELLTCANALAALLSAQEVSRGT